MGVYNTAGGCGGVFLDDADAATDEMERLRKGLEARGLSIEAISAGDGFLLSDSSTDLYSGEDVATVFNGYLYEEPADDPSKDCSPAEYCAALYRDDVRSLPEDIAGRFRAAVYDKEKDSLTVISDRAGDPFIYYAPLEDGILFSSHLTALMACDRVSPVIDRQAVYDYLLTGNPSAFSSDATLVEGVKLMNASELLRWTGGAYETRTYWDPLEQGTRQVSDSEAAERTKQLLKEAAQAVTQQEDGPLHAMFTGGMDSSVIAALLDQAGDADVKLHTVGEVEGIYGQGQESADMLGLPRQEIQLPSTLVTERELWQVGQPSPALRAWRLGTLPDHGLDHVFSGQDATAVFPARYDRFRELDRFRRGQPLFQILYRTGADQLLSRIPGVAINTEEAVEILGSPYRSTAITRVVYDNRRNIEALLSADGYDLYGLERELDERWQLDRPRLQQRLDETVTFLELRERAARVAGQAISPFMPHHNMFSYPPLVEYQFSLPMEQRRNRQMLRRVMTDILPEELAQRLEQRGSTQAQAGGEVEYYSRACTHHFTENWDEYVELIEQFLERGFMDVDTARARLIDASMSEKGWLEKMAIGQVYLLERWIQTFLERDSPWRPP